jgi:predicted acyltransferase (DUF342 family)
LKNTKGSTLILAVVVLSVLMILATSIMSFMLAEHKQAIFHQNKTKAYYTAKSGAAAVEAAILKMNESQLEELEKSLPISSVNIQGLQDGNSSLSVRLDKEDGALVIISTASVNGVKEVVEKVLYGITSGETIRVEHALFSNNDITMSGSATITGSIATNGSIHVSGNPNIRDIYLLDGERLNPPYANWLSNWQEQYREYRLSSPVVFPPFDFPSFPVFPVNHSTKDFSLSGTDSHTVYESTDYRNLTINSNTSFYIDTSSGDITLNIKKLELSQGHIVILGGNKVRINVGDLIIGGSSTINSNGNPKNLTIHKNNSSEVNISGDNIIKGDIYIERGDLFVSGSASIVGNVYTKGDRINLSGAQSIVGTLFIENGDLTISGSGQVHGSIFSNGDKVTLSGSAKMAKGILYAPNASIIFSGSGNVEGAVISGETELSGSGLILYNPEYVNNASVPSVVKHTGYERGYYR